VYDLGIFYGKCLTSFLLVFSASFFIWLFFSFLSFSFSISSQGVFICFFFVRFLLFAAAGFWGFSGQMESIMSYHFDLVMV
jgi:hypothetical protein